MDIEISNNEKATKDFNNILELTQTVSDNIAQLRVKRFRNLIGAFTCATLIFTSLAMNFYALRGLPITMISS